MTLITAAAAQPNRALPTPSLQTRGEYGLIAIAQSSYAPDTDPTVAASLAASGLQERLRGEVLARVKKLKGYNFAPATQDVAPTMLEVRIERIVLAKDSLMDDAPALVLRARARLVQPAYGRSIYDQKIEFRSPKRTMPEWRAYDAAAVRADLDEGLKELAQKAADDIFLVYAGPQQP